MRAWPKAMFESWRGSYNDSPRAVSEYLGRVRPQWRRLWVAGDPDAFPGDVATVRRHSPAYFKDLFTADVLFANDIISRHLVKGPRLTYVQLWHGTPLKLIGHDERALAYSGAQEHLARMDRDVAKWDYLVSPSAACTALFRSAFGFEGPVWETGYPRNDVLRSEGAAALRAETRGRLGLAEDATAVLYVPTWRDSDRTEDGRFTLWVTLDTTAFAACAPPGTVLVSRMHKNITARTDLDDRGVVIDGNAVADIAALYLAADVLVSDYSSAVYDFAVTGKPIILFAPDLERYRDAERGFYFDYEEWAPGPIAFTTEEVAALLGDPAGLRAEYAERYQAFTAKFCPHEDGHATERLCDLLFDALG